MRWNKINAIFKKEIRELFRDKKTLFVMFALPLLIYPLLIMGISTVIMNVQSGYETSEYKVGVADSVTDQKLHEFIEKKGEDEDASLVITKVEGDYIEAIQTEAIDTYLYFDKDEYCIAYNSADKDSTYASDYLEDKLKDYKENMTVELLAAENLDSDKFLNPIKFDKEDLASGEASMGNVLGMIVPLLLIMGVFMGTMTPAMDSTAGEKERGTQETLMSFPISSHELICGKYLAVSAAGVLSAFLYLLSVGILAGYMYMISGMSGSVPFNLGLFVPSLLVVIISTIAFALFLGAVIMCVCSFAKSTKEASSYISPMMVVIMLIAYAGYLDIGLTVNLSIVPVLNIVLLIKSVLAFDYNTLAIILVLVSNIAYAAIAITVLGKLYTSERILFGENLGSLFDRHSERKKGALPAVGDGILVLMVTAVLYLYLGSLFQVKLPLLLGVAASHIFIVGMPILAAWYGRIDMKKTFSVNKLSVMKLPALIILAIGAFIVCNFLCYPLSHIASSSTEQFSSAMSAIMEDQSVWLIWIVVAMVPAISEEVMFRGYFMSSLKSKTKPVVYILVSSLIFGAYHMNFYQGCYAFLLGIILGYAVYKTGSIFASALMHFICNSIAVLLDATTIINLDNISNGAIIGIVIAGFIMLAVGLLLLSRGKNEASATVQ